jgi:hypothetical protein
MVSQPTALSMALTSAGLGPMWRPSNFSVGGKIFFVGWRSGKSTDPKPSADTMKRVDSEAADVALRRGCTVAENTAVRSLAFKWRGHTKLGRAVEDSVREGRSHHHAATRARRQNRPPFRRHPDGGGHRGCAAWRPQHPSELPRAREAATLTTGSSAGRRC